MDTILLLVIAIGIWVIAYAVVKNSRAFTEGGDKII